MLLNKREQEKKALYYERFHHPHPRVQLKIEAVWLKSQDLPHQKICQLAGISGNTLRNYLQDYQAGGIKKLCEINFYRPQSKLEKERETLKAYFQKNPNLNLIERLWKFVKKKCLYSKYYPEFSLFKTAIANCIESANGKHKKELDSLLTLRFQTFNKAQIMTV